MPFPHKGRDPSTGKFAKADGRLPTGIQVPQTDPETEQGVGGSQIYGGFLENHEKDSTLKGTDRYKTFSNLLANIAILGASVRLFLSMVGGANWKFEPADDSDEARRLAEETEDLLTRKMQTPWHRVVRRLAMYRMYGFAVSEWTAERLPDGRMSIKTVKPRPQITIEEWLTNVHGDVLGVVQVDPQTGRRIPIPRAKLVYLVDDAISDTPEGLGLFRHVVDSGRRLRRMYQLEGYGYEADMRGIPVGRAPLAELDQLVQKKKLTKAKAKELVDGLDRFLSSHIKNPALGIMIDSTPYRNAGDQRGVSSTPMWDVSLLDGGSYSFDALANAIVRTQREMARVFGTEHMMLGENAAGSRSLSNDKTTIFGLLVDGALKEIAEQLDSDLVTPLFDLNGWNQDLRPTPKPNTQVFRNVSELTAAIRDLAVAGVQLDRQDEVVQEIIEELGFPRLEKLDKIDPDLIIGADVMQSAAAQLNQDRKAAQRPPDKESQPQGKK